MRTNTAVFNLKLRMELLLDIGLTLCNTQNRTLMDVHVFDFIHRDLLVSLHDSLRHYSGRL